MNQKKGTSVHNIADKQGGGRAASVGDRENSRTFANGDREEVLGRTGSSSGSTRNTPLNQAHQRGMGGLKKTG